MKITHSVCTLVLTGLLSACSSSDKKDPTLEEAARYHEQATAIQAELEPKIGQIDSLKTMMMAVKMPATEARIATLDSLKSAFEEWEANLVEVPGMPHNHSHEHGDHAHHKHADATLKDLPADQMRDLQRETLNAIKQIQTRLETVTKPN
jgi:hypothetical protein